MDEQLIGDNSSVGVITVGEKGDVLGFEIGFAVVARVQAMPGGQHPAVCRDFKTVKQNRILKRDGEIHTSLAGSVPGCAFPLTRTIHESTH